MPTLMKRSDIGGFGSSISIPRRDGISIAELGFTTSRLIGWEAESEAVVWSIDLDKGEAMTEKYVSTSTITIDAPVARVWSAITDSAAIKEFMFGTDVVTTWTVGGPIIWRGVWEGKEYEDKGIILELEPGRRLVNTHFSALSGQDDVPENYHTLTWELEGKGNKTGLTLSQDNNASAAEAEHSKGMWDSLVKSVKLIAERG